MLRTVTVLLYPQFGLLDVAGPIDVLTIANQRAGQQLYSINTVALGRHQNVRSESGLTMGVSSFANSNTHTLLIPGGNGFRDVITDTRAVKTIKLQAKRSRRVATVCTGAFILAETGLLKNRRVTTHWAYAEELSSRHKNIDVIADELFIHSGKYLTSAGIAAGIDLALALVALDHGEQLASETSKRMVLYLRRTGGQSQFSERQLLPDSDNDTLNQLIIDIIRNPKGNLSNGALAERLGVTERHIGRLFRERTGTSPARWVERVRVDHARELLEKSNSRIELVAANSGFASVDTMRQAFKRVIGVSPSQYRMHH
jgi:transcriptional regulator GlxA family with amidase domain